MLLTIQTLFNDPDIVSATIDRVLQQGLDRIYWQQYLTFRRTTTRVFKDYLGTVTGVVAGSINSRYGEKPIRERKPIGSGYGEIAYLGDKYQMDVERLSELQDLIDKYNEAKTEDQVRALNDIIQYIADDYRQIILAPHKRMDIVVGELLMKGASTVKNKDDNKGGIDVLDIQLPFHFVTPTKGDIFVDSKNMFISWLQQEVLKLAPKFGKFDKMAMSRGTFAKWVQKSSEFSDTFKMVLNNTQYHLAANLMTSEMASNVFMGIGLPAVEIKEDYVEEQDGTNHQIYADNRITFLHSDQIGYMRHHTPYEATDPVPGRTYNPVSQDSGQMLVCNYRDENGRYMEYTAEWVPQIAAPNKIVNVNLESLVL